MQTALKTPSTSVELLQALISIPSVNPDGDPGTDRTGESDCARFVGAFLEQCGAEVSFEEVLPGRPNVIGRFPVNESGKPKFLFAPHTDTVGVGGMTVDPFGGEIRDGKIWGRGASDTKGTMAAMLWALWKLRDRIADLGAEIAFTGLMGEESGQPGSDHFAINHEGAFDFALVGEPTELDIVHTHKSCIWVEISATGHAVHGATPELGENAVLKIARAVEAIDAELPPEFAAFENPVLGKPTVNVGMINGGTRTNIVPDRCTAMIDFRETPELARAGGAKGKLAGLLQRHGWAEEIVVDSVVDSTPLDTDPENPFVKKLQGLGSKLTGAPWFCDAGRLAEGNIPAIACGPGSIAQAHTKDEFIEIEAFEAGVDFYCRFLESL